MNSVAAWLEEEPVQAADQIFGLGFRHKQMFRSDAPWPKRNSQC
jgi:hypothetical protein